MFQEKKIELVKNQRQFLYLTNEIQALFVFKMKISGLRKGNVFFIKAIKPKILGDLIFKYYS
jgi:hypothetical protein